MLFDTHMHCDFSCDSEMVIEDAALAAAAQGLGMIVTEHWDYDYPTNPEAFLFDIDAYFKRFARFRSDRLLLGIEIGMQPHTAAKDRQVASGHDFDFVLGSIHCIGRRDLYEKECYEGFSRGEIIEEFFRDTIACLKQERDFDAFAHIDYMCRYWPYTGDEAQLRLKDAPELCDEVFRLLIEQEKPIEINTRRLSDAAATGALAALYRRYHALGGRYCTLGSDAHCKEHVGRRIEEAADMAEAAGLRPVYFKKRKMQFLEGCR